MSTAVIYARVSSVTERQNTDRQVADLERYAEASNLALVKTFTEHISGAKKNSERPILTECIEYCKTNHISILLANELSRIGRSTFEVMETIKVLADNHINLYLQKEQFTLLDSEGKPSVFAAIMLATLSTCAQLERDNIKFRLNSGRAQYIAKGGKLGRKQGSTKSHEAKAEEYKDAITLLKKGYSVRNTAKLVGKGVATIVRLKKEFKL